MKLSSLNEVRLIVLRQDVNNFDEINNFFMNNYWNKIGIFVKLKRKGLNEMEELKQFQGSAFDTISRWNLVEDRDTILELAGKIQELQNEINCMNDSRDFQDAESARSGHSHVTSQPAFFTPCQNPSGMLSRSLGMPSRNDGPPSIWHTHGIAGNVFANPTASSSAHYPQESNPLSSDVSEHTSPQWRKVKGKKKFRIRDASQDRQPEIHSVVPSEWRSSKNYGADQQRLQISDHFDNFPTPATFACWKIRFKTEECTCLQFPTEAMLWINEVEMVESVDDLKSSRSVRGIRMPDFEVLDTKIASALNPIIHNTRFKRKAKKNKKRTVSFEVDRLPTWSTITSWSLEPMILSKTTPTCSLLVFELMIFRNSIRSGMEYYCLWRKSHLMTSWKDCTN